MASKNMFEVLHQDSSDDEEKPKRSTKHEQRATEKVNRESVGDKVNKDNQFDKNNRGTAKQEKGGYSGEGKRDHDRRSGTGKDTHNKYEKKGGQGKGNWGTNDTEYEKKATENTEEKQVANDEPEEKEPEVVSMDDYMKDNSVNLQMQHDVATEQSGDVKVEKGMHVLKKKDEDWVTCDTRSKNHDAHVKMQTGVLEGAEHVNDYRSNRGGDRGGRGGDRGGRGGRGGQGRGGQTKSKNLGNDDFPALG